MLQDSRTKIELLRMQIIKVGQPKGERDAGDGQSLQDTQDTQHCMYRPLLVTPLNMGQRIILMSYRWFCNEPFVLFNLSE